MVHPTLLTRRAVTRLHRAALLCSAVTAVLILLSKPLAGQSLIIPRSRSEAEIIAAAEADGAAYPRLTLPSSTSANWRSADLSAIVAHFDQTGPYGATLTSGATARRCVVGYDMGPVRSGEFTIGGNLSGTAAMHAGRQGKVWWAPVHHASDMPPLVVRGRSLTNPNDTLRYTTATIAWPVTPGLVPALQPARKYFFPSGITVPRPGRWLLIATSGLNWGCFILSVN